MQLLGTRKGNAKSKRLVCKEAGWSCEVVFEGKKDDDLVAQAVNHASEAHGAPLTAGLATQYRQLIKDA